MEVYLSRNHQTCLHLFPLSVGRFQNVFSQPNDPDGQPPHFVISRFISPVEALDRNLKGIVIQDLSGLSQLNALVKAADSDERIYWSFEDIVEFAKSHDVLLTIHAGHKANGIDTEITSAVPVRDAILLLNKNIVNLVM